MAKEGMDEQTIQSAVDSLLKACPELAQNPTSGTGVPQGQGGNPAATDEPPDFPYKPKPGGGSAAGPRNELNIGANKVHAEDRMLCMGQDSGRDLGSYSMGFQRDLDILQEQHDLDRRRFTPVMRDNYRAFRGQGYSHSTAMDKARESFDNTMRAIRRVGVDNELQGAADFARCYLGAPEGDGTPYQEPYRSENRSAMIAMDGLVVAVRRPKPVDGQGIVDEAVRQAKLAASRWA
jgi:hypothetical protein